MARSRILCIASICVTALGCHDRAPPTWPAASSLEATESGQGAVRVTWPAAQDAPVAAYVLQLNDGGEWQIADAARETVIAGLEPGRTHAVRVWALDPAGNRSAPLATEFSIRDRTPPRFASDAELIGIAGEVSAEGQQTFHLSWPEAEDAAGVRIYRVLFDEVEILRTPTAVVDVTIPAPASGQFGVQALDEAGNESDLLGWDWGAPRPPLEEVPPSDAADGNAVPEPPEPGSLPARPPRPEPIVTLLVTLREGGEAPDADRAALEARNGGVRACYRREIESGPTFDGLLVMSVELDAEGHVASIATTDATIGRSRLSRCVQSVLRRTVMAPGAPRTLRVRYDFRPSG